MSLTKETFLENLRRSIPSSSPIPIPEPNETKKGRPKGAKRGSAESKPLDVPPKDVRELTRKAGFGSAELTPKDVRELIPQLTPHGGSLRELTPKHASFEGNYSNMFF